ncbi:MAG: chemotaxis protein CheD [Candidatus Marinimicrobia bacterium]|nr:chemotaxis protein CheD [Candidatus Neomarinimicrobiota bacterium]
MSDRDSRNTQEGQEDVFYLEPGYMYIGSEKNAVKTVLGNCVSVCLWDEKLRFGGMNHFLYPVTQDKNKATAQFGNIATKVLINKMFAAGSKVENIVAQIIGGAEIKSGSNLGLENVKIARKILEKENIQIKSEDVGGHLGRKVIFDVQTGHLMVIKVHQIRSSDWIDLVLDEKPMI